MGDHPLLPPIQDTFSKGDAEAHASAIRRRFPALCKLLATLVTASPPKSQDPAYVSFFFVFFFFVFAVVVTNGGNPLK